MEYLKHLRCINENEDRHNRLGAPQKIVVFQQQGSGEKKIAALRKLGGEHFALEVISLDSPLPDIIDDPYEFIPRDLDAQLVLDFLSHPDLAYDLATTCRDRGIPIIASGKKTLVKEVIIPPT